MELIQYNKSFFFSTNVKNLLNRNLECNRTPLSYKIFLISLQIRTGRRSNLSLPQIRKLNILPYLIRAPDKKQMTITGVFT
jgi:hypothetical protein